ETDVGEKGEAPADLAQHFVRDRGLFFTELRIGQQLLRLAYRQRGDGVDRPAADAYVARLPAQPRAAAVGTGEVAAIAAQEDANVDLVFLPLKPSEESADAVVRIVALDDECPFLFRQLRPRGVEPGTRFLGRPLQLRELCAIVRLAPGLDRALIDRLRRIGNDQTHVQLDDVAEAVTGRAGAERVVEGKQTRLRRLVGDAALAAFESLRELNPVGARDRGSGIRFRFRIPDPGSRIPDDNGERSAAAFAIGRFNRIRQTGAKVAFDLQAVDDHIERRAIP